MPNQCRIDAVSMPNMTPEEGEKRIRLREGSASLQKPLRAKGALISESRVSTPCEMRFFPRDTGKMAFVDGFSLKMAFCLYRVGKIASRRGVENRGSLTSVPLVFRDCGAVGAQMRAQQFLNEHTVCVGTRNAPPG